MSVVAHTPARPRTRLAPLHQRAVERVIADVSRRLDERITLREMAAKAYLSPFHFHRIFRRATGLPPGRFLAALRIQEAKRLLVYSDLSVTEISLAVGYHSLSTFSSQFSRFVGQSPQSLRDLAGTFGCERAIERVGLEDVSARTDDGAGTIEGRLLVEEDFAGTAFVCLFPARIAEGLPVGFTVTAAPGRFLLRTAAEGDCHVLAAALPRGADGRSYLAPHGDLLVGRSSRAIESRRGGGVHYVEVALALPRLTDPPVLFAPTALLRDRARRGDGAVRRAARIRSGRGEGLRRPPALVSRRSARARAPG